MVEQSIQNRDWRTLLTYTQKEKRNGLRYSTTLIYKRTKIRSTRFSCSRRTIIKSKCKVTFLYLACKALTIQLISDITFFDHGDASVQQSDRLKLKSTPVPARRSMHSKTFTTSERATISAPVHSTKRLANIIPWTLIMEAMKLKRKSPIKIRTSLNCYQLCNN